MCQTLWIRDFVMRWNHKSIEGECVRMAIEGMPPSPAVQTTKSVSQDGAPMFSLRVVSLEYYLSAPLPGMDVCYSKFQGELCRFFWRHQSFCLEMKKTIILYLMFFWLAWTWWFRSYCEWGSSCADLWSDTSWSKDMFALASGEWMLSFFLSFFLSFICSSIYEL